MEVRFGLKLDEAPFAIETKGQDSFVCGPLRFLQWLEKWEGLVIPEEDVEFLRLEKFRQHLQSFLADEPSAFFYTSFVADPFGTSRRLLDMRDDLILAGWNFKVDTELPERLLVFGKIEQQIQQSSESADFPLGIPGFAERFTRLHQRLHWQELPFTSLTLAEPLELLPPFWQAFFKKCEQYVTLNAPEQEDQNDRENDLGFLKESILSGKINTSNKPKAKGDGSIVLLRTRRSSQAANWLARFLSLNSDFKPLCIFPEKNRQLDNALIQEGAPSLGILSASLARPSLQILKLVTAFLWEPIDPFKLLEFVSLGLKPMEAGLGRVVARSMASKPGILGEDWNIAIQSYFESLLRAGDPESTQKHQQAQRDYNFWFLRERYSIENKAPKNEILKIFDRIQYWSREEYEAGNEVNNSLLVLSEQARKIKELLLTLPETQLGFLELERIVRTIYEPSPIEFKPQEAGRFPYVYHPGAVFSESDDLLWWNFCEKEQVRFFSKWFKEEIRWLEDNEVIVDRPEWENQRRLFLQLNPIKKVQKRLLLVMPETVYGTSVNPHPLFGYLEAVFDQHEKLLYDLDSEADIKTLQNIYKAPESTNYPIRRLGLPKPILEIDSTVKIPEDFKATPSSLESLVYYPYQWLFRYRLQLLKSSILSIVEENTLYGNLAHRVFEKLLEQDFYTWTRAHTYQWLDNFFPEVLPKEGAVLLMYGKEPERISFENKVKFAAWHLVEQLQKNNWEVEATESRLSGNYLQMDISGISDLILKREDERCIIDLKWSGATYRSNLVKNEEDIQLSLYTELYHNSTGILPYSGYYILSRARLVTRDRQIFDDVNPLQQDADHQDIHQRLQFKLQSTLQWRLGQLRDGKVEIRCKQTSRDLEDYYFEKDENLLNYLEMKSEDATFDDYRTLIQLIE
jgi:ATP-dependent helicase/nuclease subunit B